MSDLKAKRQARLIHAARDVFVTQGFRGATMEKIAEVATVSKATLYSYFPDKPAIFDAVAASVAQDLLTIVETTLDAVPSPEDAVIAALIAKHEYIRALVRTSRFATELFHAKDAMSAHHFQQTDATICGLLAQRLSEVRDESEECVALLLAASQGIANAAQSEDQLRVRISKLSVLTTTF